MLGVTLLWRSGSDSTLALSLYDDSGFAVRNKRTCLTRCLFDSVLLVCGSGNVAYWSDCARSAAQSVGMEMGEWRMLMGDVWMVVHVLAFSGENRLCAHSLAAACGVFGAPKFVIFLFAFFSSFFFLRAHHSPCSCLCGFGVVWCFILFRFWVFRFSLEWIVDGRTERLSCTLAPLRKPS